MRLPDGSPAAGVPVKIDVQESSEKSLKGITDQDGTMFPVFNIQTVSQITVKVSIPKTEVKVLSNLVLFSFNCFHIWLQQVTADGVQQSKVIRSISSPSNSYLYLSVTNKVYSVNDLLSIKFNTRNGAGAGFIYYMVRHI